MTVTSRHVRYFCKHGVHSPVFRELPNPLGTRGTAIVCAHTRAVPVSSLRRLWQFVLSPGADGRWARSCREGGISYPGSVTLQISTVAQRSGHDVCSVSVCGIAGVESNAAAIYVDDNTILELARQLNPSSSDQENPPDWSDKEMTVRGSACGVSNGAYVWAIPGFASDVPGFPVRILSSGIVETNSFKTGLKQAQAVGQHKTPIACWLSPCAAQNLGFKNGAAPTLRLLHAAMRRQDIGMVAKLNLEVVAAMRAGSTNSLLGSWEIRRLLRWLAAPARGRVVAQVWCEGMICNIKLGTVEFTLRVKSMSFLDKNEKKLGKVDGGRGQGDPLPMKAKMAGAAAGATSSGVELCWSKRSVAAGLVEQQTCVTVEEPSAAAEVAAEMEKLSMAAEDSGGGRSLLPKDGTCRACEWAKQAGEHIGGLHLELNRATHSIHAALADGRGRAVCSGMLISGLPGVGKTAMIEALVASSPFRWVRKAGTELFAAARGATEDRIRAVFRAARKRAPCLLIIDEIDAIAAAATRRSEEVERRGLLCLLACLDALRDAEEAVFVVGATNRLEAVDDAVRSASRLGLWLRLNVPRSQERREILQVLARGVEGCGGLEEMARRGHGYTAADMKLVLGKAVAAAAHRRAQQTGEAEEEDGRGFETEDVLQAMKEVEPAVVRGRRRATEGETILWSHLRGVDEVKAELEICVLGALRQRDKFEQLGVDAPRGVLLYGPPGTGKTALALALGEEVADLANFIRIDASEVVSAAVGASERAIASTFQQARACSPCLLFIDDVDSLFPPRTAQAASDHNSLDRILSQFLIELDGINTDPQRPVMLVAATSRPLAIDAAILRPGRLEHHVLVPPPDLGARLSLLRYRFCVVMDCDAGVQHEGFLERTAQDTEGFSIADIISVCREAAMSAIRQHIAGHGHGKVVAADVQHALSLVSPSLLSTAIERPPRPWQLASTTG